MHRRLRTGTTPSLILIVKSMIMKNLIRRNIFFLCLFFLVSVAPAQGEPITAPNGAVADAGFAQTLQLIYPQPTVEKASDGIWVLGGYSITNQEY